MNTKNKFLLIDDDTIATMLYSMVLKRALGDSIDVQSFNNPEEGVYHLKNELKNSEVKSQTFLFLDINMPILMGWDVIDLIDKMDDNIKEQITIYMLSSSISQKDKKRALDHQLVSDFIEKPLTLEKIHALFL
jgi:CheY-like chemotaxis protein